jgi:hypothetical protein
MFKFTKILMSLWLLWCMSIAVFSAGGRITTGLDGGAGADATYSEMSVEETMARNPDLSQQEAEELLSRGQDAAVVGESTFFDFGFLDALLIWFAGMIPLLIMFVVFKPSGTTLMVQQAVGDAGASQSLPSQDDD